MSMSTVVLSVLAQVRDWQMSVLPPRLCIELWASFDACGVSSCGIWAGRRPPLGSSQAERSVISEG